MPENESIFISAGDPSGDIAGYRLLKELKQRNRELSFFGLGHGRMKAAGQEQIVDGKELAVLGFWEVAKKYLFFRRLMLDTVRQIETIKPKAIVLIDYPGFNLRLAEKIKHLKIPIIYYVSPQIWAWGGKRIHKIKELIDLMLLILPFETEIYNKAEIPNRFVGHYLFDDISPEYIKAPYNFDSRLIALLPGSRPQEVERMLPTMINAAKKISKNGEYEFVIAGVEGKVDYQKYIDGTDLKLSLTTGKTRELIRDSRLVITSSGTATLETGIIGRPMIVIYKTGMLTYLIARSLVKLEHIALINISAGDRVVPELIQGAANSESIASEANSILSDNARVEEMIQKLNLATDSFNGPGTSIRAAEALLELINC